MPSYFDNSPPKLNPLDAIAWLYARIFVQHVLEDRAALDEYDPDNGRVEMMYDVDLVNSDDEMMSLAAIVPVEYAKVVEASKRVNLDPPPQQVLVCEHGVQLHHDCLACVWDAAPTLAHYEDEVAVIAAKHDAA